MFSWRVAMPTNKNAVFSNTSFSEPTLFLLYFKINFWKFHKIILTTSTLLSPLLPLSTHLLYPPYFLSSLIEPSHQVYGIIEKFSRRQSKWIDHKGTVSSGHNRTDGHMSSQSLWQHLQGWPRQNQASQTLPCGDRKLGWGPIASWGAIGDW